MRSRYLVRLPNREVEVTLLERSGESITFEMEGERHTVEIAPLIERGAVGGAGAVTVPPPAASPRARTTNGERSGDRDGIRAPMPGIIVSVSVGVGTEVKAGETVVVMEAMKMENNLTAPRAGKIKAVHVAAGAEVENHQLLVELEPAA